MRIYDLTEEAFDIQWIRTKILDKQDYVDVGTSGQQNATRLQWEELFALAAEGTKYYDVRLYSPEVLWADIVNLNVPPSWPDSTITEDEVTRQKKLYEYTYVLRSVTDPTKCMIKYSRFNVYNGVESQKYVKPYSYHKLTHEEFRAYYVYFSGFSTYQEAKAWKELNVPAEE